MEKETDDTARSVSIIFEDEDVCVVAKPSGMTTHKDGKRDEYTLADWFVEHYPDAQGVGEPLTLTNGTVIDRPGIVHRLDKGTSGVLVLARNQEAFTHLKAQFQDRLVEKEYRAFVWGRMKDDSGVIDKPIGRSRGDFRKRSAEFGAKPPLRDAETRYAVIARGNEHTYLTLTPKTGRMHQLRVHLKAVGNPIVCDGLYAPKKKSALGFERLALHASAITLTLPSGPQETFTAPLPKDFIEAERRIADIA
ncbi:MAG: RluA family pseudouridine synthase [Patescibacteria group bacterium UBA2163]